MLMAAMFPGSSPGIQRDQLSSGTNSGMPDSRAFTLLGAGNDAVAWPKRSRHYTVRTLLIAATLIAVVLGLLITKL
jgi:hypothetical protein